MHLKLLLTSAVCDAKVANDAKIFMAAIASIYRSCRRHHPLYLSPKSFDFIPPHLNIEPRIDLTSVD